MIFLKFNPHSKFTYLFPLVLFSLVVVMLIYQTLGFTVYNGAIFRTTKKLILKNLENQQAQSFTIYSHPLGQGSYSKVFLAKNKAANEWLAVKIQPYTEPEDIQHEVKYLKILGDFRGEKILTNGHTKMHYLFSKLAPGIAVDSLFKQQHTLSKQEILQIILSSFQALQTIHEQHVIHNDIHEGNLMYDPSQKTSYWVDMAFSLKLEPNQQFIQIKGDLSKLPPCQKAPESNLFRGYASDIYQLGFMAQRLFFILNEENPTIRQKHMDSREFSCETLKKLSTITSKASTPQHSLTSNTSTPHPKIFKLFLNMMHPKWEKRPTIQEATEILSKEVGNLDF